MYQSLGVVTLGRYGSCEKRHLEDADDNNDGFPGSHSGLGHPVRSKLGNVLTLLVLLCDEYEDETRLVSEELLRSADRDRRVEPSEVVFDLLNDPLPEETLLCLGLDVL